MGFPLLIPLGLTALRATLPRIIASTGGRNLITRGATRMGNIPRNRSLVPTGGGGAGITSVQQGAIPGVSKGTMLATATSLGGYGYLADQYGNLADEAEVSANQPLPPVSEEQKKRDKEDEVGGIETKRTKKDDADDLSNQIKKGNLDDFIKERMDLFNKYLGDSKGQLKSAGFAALTEFGLNLASAKGGNLMDKIARSAKDPLKTFTAIGMAAKDRADKIKMAAVESGIEAQEAALDRAAESDDTTTTFQKNLNTLTAMFTNEEGQLTVDKEDLINMAKSGATTSKKKFFADNYSNYAGKTNELGVPYSPAEINSILERGWAIVSGQTSGATSEPPEGSVNNDPLGIK